MPALTVDEHDDGTTFAIEDYLTRWEFERCFEPSGPLSKDLMEDLDQDVKLHLLKKRKECMTNDLHLAFHVTDYLQMKFPDLLFALAKQDIFRDNTHKDRLVYHAELDDVSGNLLLKPPIIPAKSNRLWRKFSASRFLHIHYISPKAKNMLMSLRRRFTLLKSTFELLEYDPAKELQMCRYVMLEGPYQSGSMQSVFSVYNWYINLKLNQDLSFSKYISRLRLGLCDTHKTHFIHGSIPIDTIADKSHPVTEAVMTDGAAPMSHALAMHVATSLHINFRDLPSAFQGRLLGNKGVWYAFDRTETCHMLIPFLY